MTTNHNDDGGFDNEQTGFDMGVCVYWDNRSAPSMHHFDATYMGMIAGDLDPSAENAIHIYEEEVPFTPNETDNVEFRFAEDDRDAFDDGLHATLNERTDDDINITKVSFHSEEAVDARNDVTYNNPNKSDDGELPIQLGPDGDTIEYGHADEIEVEVTVRANGEEHTRQVPLDYEDTDQLAKSAWEFDTTVSERLTPGINEMAEELRDSPKAIPRIGENSHVVYMELRPYNEHRGERYTVWGTLEDGLGDDTEYVRIRGSWVEERSTMDSFRDRAFQDGDLTGERFRLKENSVEWFSYGTPSDYRKSWHSNHVIVPGTGGEYAELDIETKLTGPDAVSAIEDRIEEDTF